MRTQLDGVRLRYPGGKVALDGIALAFEAGEQVAIIGPSGAGKTTLLHVLAAALEPTSGRVSILGTDPWPLASAARHAFRRRIFLAPQSPPLPPRQRVVHAVLAGRLAQWGAWRALRSLWRPPEAAEAFAALARFQLEDKLWLRCDRLSGGERQRVGLARGLVSDAGLFLLDEPVSSLDPVLGLAALTTLQDEAARRGATLVVSLHDVDLARQQFSRLVGVRAGRVHFDLPTRQVDEAQLAELYGAEFRYAHSEAPAPPAEESPPSPRIARCF